MASIKPHPAGGWRAQIFKAGHRASKVCATKEDAERWAAARERMIGIRCVTKTFDQSELVALIPKRTLEAMKRTRYTRHEIVESAMPMSLVPCIYFLVRDGEVVYVGQTTNLAARLYKHRQRGVDFDSFAQMPCPAEDMDRLEADYIDALLPEMNVSAPIRARRHSTTTSASRAHRRTASTPRRAPADVL